MKCKHTTRDFSQRRENTEKQKCKEGFQKIIETHIPEQILRCDGRWSQYKQCQIIGVKKQNSSQETTDKDNQAPRRTHSQLLRIQGDLWPCFLSECECLFAKLAARAQSDRVCIISQPAVVINVGPTLFVAVISAQVVCVTADWKRRLHTQCVICGVAKWAERTQTERPIRLHAL